MTILLALPLLLGPGEAPDAVAEGPAPGAVSYQIRLVDCEALGWRSEFQPRLRFGGHRAGSSAWVADLETLEALADRIAHDTDAKLVAAPRVTASPGDPAIIGTSTTRHLVVHAEPTGVDAPEPANDADAPTDAPTSLRPVVVPVDDGAQIKLVGRPVAEGIHLGVEVVDCRVSAVHEVEAEAPEGVDPSMRVKFQVPEVARREMGGEWLVPAGHGLILSLGVASSPSPDSGTPSVRERLLLISASHDAKAPARPTADHRVARTEATATAPQAATAPIAMPAPPSPSPSAIAGAPTPGPAPVIRASGAPTALASTPWGLLPIIPIEFVPADSDPAVGVASAASIPTPALPSLPSRNLPHALDAEGRPVDPRTDKDREAERTDFEPFVDGKPVPSPQATTPPPAIATPGPDPSVRPTSGEATADAPKTDSMVKVRVWFTLSRGLGADVDVNQKAIERLKSRNVGIGRVASECCEAPPRR